MTKEQFDSQCWRKGVRVRIFGSTHSYAVTRVDFSGFVYVEGKQTPFLYRNLIVEEDEGRA